MCRCFLHINSVLHPDIVIISTVTSPNCNLYNCVILVVCMQIVLMLWYCLYCAQRLQMLALTRTLIDIQTITEHMCWYSARGLLWCVILFQYLSTCYKCLSLLTLYVGGHYSGLTVCGMPAELFFFSFVQFPGGFVCCALFSSTQSFINMWRLDELQIPQLRFEYSFTELYSAIWIWPANVQ